jgi:hypothetical protein
MSAELLHYADDALNRIFRNDYNYNKTGCIAMGGTDAPDSSCP